VANHHMWTYAVQLANTLKTCHYGFSFIWSNGRHDAATAGLENTLLERYQAAFARNLSYPAFTNFSMDQDYGDGDFNNGSPTGCVNCGWQWKVTGDTATSWSASFTNTQVTKPSTTDVTPRNAQLFKIAPGTSLKWRASTGQTGVAVADSYGLVTVGGVELVPGSETTVTIQGMVKLAAEPELLPIPDKEHANHSAAGPDRPFRCPPASSPISTYARRGAGP
jgi:hypothetical protein